MKRDKRLLGASCRAWVIWLVVVISAKLIASPSIVPSPTSVTMETGTTSITDSSTIYYADASLAELAAIFQEELVLVHGLDLHVQAGSAAAGGDILLTLDASLPDTEQYRLTVDDTVTLEARGATGLYPGTVSILQAITEDEGAMAIPRMTIVDTPHRAFRGVMIDIKNQWHSVDDIKQIIRMCRFYKVKFCSLHTGEEQWIGALLDQTTDYPEEVRRSHRLYTKAEMADIIAFARARGVSMLPHNESSRVFQGMQDAISEDFDPSDSYANFIDEFDGEGAYTGDFNDTRYWNFINEMTRRGIDQFKAGYASGVLPYYHIGPVQGEGGMNREDAARIVGYVQAKDTRVKTMFWNGIDGARNDALSALKDHVVIAYYQRWGGSSVNGYLDSGWEVVNAAWSPLYIVGSGVARTPQQVHDDWNTFRTGTDGFSGGGFDYGAINWIHFDDEATNAQVLGGMLCTWEVPLAIHMDKLRPRVPAFVEHAWNHRPWPYADGAYTEFASRQTTTDDYLTRFLMTADVPSTPGEPHATDAVFEDKILVSWGHSDNNPTGYRVHRSTVDNPATATLVATVPSAEYTDTDVSDGTSYHYWVTAFNAFGETPMTGGDSGTTGSSNPPAAVYEAFAYPAGAAIDGQDGGTGWAGGWDQTSFNGTCQINDGGLSYGDLPVSGNSIRLNPATDTPSILVNRDMLGKMGIAGTSTWTSFLLRCNQQGNGHLFVGFNAMNVGKRWGSQIAIENNGTPANVANGSTYFIVCQSVNRGGNDELYLWVNPPLDQEPRKDDADLKVTSINLGEDGRLVLNNQGYGQGSYDLDEIRAGWRWLDVNGGIDSDSDAPTPDPMTWISPPVLDGPSAASMACTTANDPDGVEYYFEETSGNPGGDSSGWQADPIYTDAGLKNGFEYSYRVKARDKSPAQNETDWSFSSSVTVDRSGEPPAAFSPQPTSVTINGGSFSYSAGARIFYETRSTTRSVENTLKPLAEVLAGELELITGIKPAVVEKTAGNAPGTGDISLEFTTPAGAFATSEEDEDQSYTMEVADTATVRGAYYKGVAYGTVTLLQAVVDGAGTYTIPRMSVADSPVASYRTVMIDLARQPSSIGMVKEVVRLARQYKLRYLQLHLTDDQNFTFPFEPVTNNITGNFTYTRAELHDLVAYADARGVTIVPEFDLPGHSSKLKASGYLDPSGSDADVAHPDNYAKIQAIIDDMLSVFVNTPFFHMGGDESSAGSALVPFLEAMNNHLRGAPEGGKRRMLLWEGFHGAPTGQLPATGDDRVIVLSWESSYNAPWDLLEAGYEIVNASWKPLYVVGSGATYRYPHASQRMWPPEILHTWDKDTFMHWEPGRPVFEDAGPSDPDTDDGIWNAQWISREDQVLGGQMLSWEQNEKTIVNDLLPRLPVMADRLWNPQGDEDYDTFETRLQAVRERVLTTVRPVEILPLSEAPGSPLKLDYRTYSGNSVTITLRNRTKIPGTIRYETAGFNDDRGAAHFQPVPETTASSEAYDGPFALSGGFGIRARLYREDDGTPVDGHDYQHFNNWENRVRVTEYEVPRRPLGAVPDFTTYGDDQIRRIYDIPAMRGPYLLEQTQGQKFDAVLQVPGTGNYQFQVQTRDGRCSIHLDLDQDGNWDANEKIIADTEPSEVKKFANLDLAQGDYRLRVDHASGAIAPVIILKIDGPGTGGSQDVTRFLKLPVDSNVPPPAPDPVTPANGADGAPLDHPLQWSANGASSYNVYLWTSGEAAPTTPTATVTAAFYQPASLDPDTTYLWQIVSHNAHGSSTSETWSFTTGDGSIGDGQLLLHEEFDGYQPGSIIGQPGMGLGESGVWEYQGTAGTFELGPGLSGPNGLVVTADGTGDLDAKIVHTVPGWGSGILYMSYLWNETAYQGHAYVSGGGGWAGAFGHAWTTAWGINNSTGGVSYNSQQTYRLVARIDFDAGETTMWADPVAETDAPVAVKSEAQAGAPRTLILRYYGTDGTIDDIRIGTDFASVAETIMDPIHLDLRLEGADLAISWNSQAGLFYDLLASTTLETHPQNWEPVDPHTGMAADPSGTNALTLAHPDDQATFYVVRAYASPGS